MVVCLTDGRANISLKKSTGDPEYIGPEAIKPTNEELEEEVNDMAAKIYGAGMSLLVIDTENKFVSSGHGGEARAEGVREVLLPPQRDGPGDRGGDGVGVASGAEGLTRADRVPVL